MTNKKSGFTLIELLVVIAIIGLLSTMSIIALNSARARSRDARRLADVKQMQTALEMWFNDNGTYPATMPSAGSQLATGTTQYILVPSAPTPFDGNCTSLNNPYVYTQQTSGASYTIAYCLGAATGGVAAGPHTATPAAITNP